ncbi:MAG: methionine biosynthesis protein MetW [Elusimicrobiota bacterium]|jgi:methionine biosynthesis protein MetW|nr:methionine biosynthesis protein MetW [Elusimicrobiota bacterium]
MKNKIEQLAYKTIASIIFDGAKVLDLGCGAGDLLDYLCTHKNINGQGLDISQDAISNCIQKGLSVFHSDIENGLDAYPDQSFDFVILFNSLQEIKNVDSIIEQCFRIGKKLIVGVPNFGQLHSRLKLLFGYSPVTKHLPYTWFNSPNIRFLTIKDFYVYCAMRRYKILDAFFFALDKPVNFLPNLFAYTSVFVISK